MSRIVRLSFVALAAAAAADKDYAILFSEWKREYGKTYASASAEVKAFTAFAFAEDKITAHNAKQLSFTMGHNEYSDLTADEFFATRLGFNASIPRAGARTMHVATREALVAAPDAVDWVKAGAVTAVKNQAVCGSCWSFSATGSMEGAYFVSSGKLISLSEEDLVQCDMTDNGCQGGLMDNAFEFVMKNGIASEAAYPYTSGSGIRGLCNTAKSNASVLTISGYKDVPAGDEDSLKTAVALQPVSVAIEADKGAFQHYKSGVLDSPFCGKKLDHGVLVVGYGAADTILGKKDYWLVKNSWGPTWGDSGYLKMVRGKNMCGVASQPSYPTGPKSQVSV